MIYVTPKKLHAKKRNKVTEAFLRLTFPSTMADQLTDGRTTDNSTLEKLRCLSASGAKINDNKNYASYVVFNKQQLHSLSIATFVILVIPYKPVVKGHSKSLGCPLQVPSHIIVTF